MEGLTVDNARVPYPDSTPDFVKVVSSLGLQVEFTEPKSERLYVGHKAAELWLPILEVTISVLVAFEAGLLVEIVKTFAGTDTSKPGALEGTGAPDQSESEEDAGPLLHVDWRVRMADGREERFVANGDEESVSKALGEFERHVRDL